MMRDDTSATVPALKERAGVVNALLDGCQTLLVRHPTLDPGTFDGRFLLYPAYTHQDPERYQPEYEDYYYRASAKPDDGIPIRGVAAVVDEFSVSQSAIPALSRHYVYTPAGIQDKYGSKRELRVLLLRVSELVSPTVIDERPNYRGCRAWIDIDGSDCTAEIATLDETVIRPVLDDAAFLERRTAIRETIGNVETDGASGEK